MTNYRVHFYMHGHSTYEDVHAYNSNEAKALVMNRNPGAQFIRSEVLK